MIGYICKYTPIEVFEAMGEEVVRIEPEVTSFNQADTLMHPNICSFAKGLLETVLDGQYEAIILTTCCDSIRRVYDILKEKLPNTFVYILDTPRIIKDAGICLYEKRIREMIEAYEQFSGKKYDDEKLEKVLMGKFGTPAIKLDENGEVTDFVMNDKCAAGTGRFLEAIARTLEIGIDEVGPAALTSKENIEITSMCTVFAESEVISLIANNKEKSDIANGVCHSIANKAYSLMKRVGLQGGYMMTGGVAKNPGVVRAVEEKLGNRLYICPEPEIVGAVGASLYALDKLQADA